MYINLLKTSYIYIILEYIIWINKVDGFHCTNENEHSNSEQRT